MESQTYVEVSEEKAISTVVVCARSAKGKRYGAAESELANNKQRAWWKGLCLPAFFLIRYATRTRPEFVRSGGTGLRDQAQRGPVKGETRRIQRRAALPRRVVAHLRPKDGAEVALGVQECCGGGWGSP